jgi:hypothetical protein
METNALGQAGYRFYNAGKKIDEQWPFSISATSAGFNPEDGNGAHSIGKFNFVAPKEGWTFVPVELQSGNETIRVNFADDLKRKYGPRGVVMLDPRWDPAKEDPDKSLEAYPMAPTEELVIERANTLWIMFLERICSDHFEDVQGAMAHGNRPRAASGFTVHALKARGYRDPAAEFLQGLKAGQQGAEPQTGTSPEMLGVLKGIQEQNKLMMTLVLSITNGQKVDPELIKALMTPTNAPAPPKPPTPTEPPVNAGVFEVEGQPKTSLEERISRRNVETVYDQPTARPKNERAKVAAKELTRDL